MLATEILAQFRELTDDLASPYLFSDASVLRYMNNAENEAARRARLLVDSSTAEVTKYSIGIGKSWLTLDPRVVFVKRFMITGQTLPIGRAHRDDMDILVPGWEDDTGTILAYVPNMETGKLRLYRTTDKAYVAKLTVVRTPLNPITISTEPEINPRYHDKLVHWMLYEAYMKNDSESFNGKKAVDHLALFEQEFGQRSSALNETWIEEQRDSFSHEGTF